MLIYIVKLLLKYNKYNDLEPKDKEFLVCSVLIIALLIVESFGEASFNFSPKNIIAGIFVGVTIKNLGKCKEICNNNESLGGNK